MQYRKFGHTDLIVSEIGFGAWAIGGYAMIGDMAIGWGDTDDQLSKKAIHRSLDIGINFFDTADIYGFGHSEELLGGLIGKKKDVIIASKVGNVSRNEQFTVDYSMQYIISACEASLRRLKREVIDFYQLHTARLQHLEKGDCIRAMELLQQQGKIRYGGLSLNSFEPEPESKYMLENNKGSGFQLVLNIINQRALPVMKQAAAKGYGIIARMPLQFGLLTGKFDESASFPENDHRKKRMTPDVIKACTTALRPVWELCNKYQCTKTALALSYILSYPEISTIIPGIRSAEQATQNTSGLFRLDERDKNLIEQLGQNDFVRVMELIQKQG